MYIKFPFHINPIQLKIELERLKVIHAGINLRRVPAETLVHFLGQPTEDHLFHLKKAVKFVMSRYPLTFRERAFSRNGEMSIKGEHVLALPEKTS